MTEEDARALLGVDAAATHGQLRRAYLRAVKKHKPERDPDGFKAVREAYELLGEMAAFEVVRAYVDEHLPPAPSAEDAADEEHDPLAVYRQRAEALDSDDECRAVWHEAVAAHPDCAEAHGRLLTFAQTEEEGAAVARAAVEAGHDEFLEVLLHTSAKVAIPKAAWRAARQSESPGVRIALFAALTRREHFDRAVVLLDELFGAPNESSSGRVPGSSVVIELIAGLCRKAKFRSARRALRTTTTWLADNGVERAWLSGNEPQWLLLRELVSAGGELPPPIRRPMATSIRRGKPAVAARAAARLDAEDAREALEVLEHRAPVWHGLLHGPLQHAARDVIHDHRSRVREADNRGTGGIGAFLAVLSLVIGGGRLCSSTSSTARPVTVSQVEPLGDVQVVRALSEENRDLADEVRDILEDARRGGCWSASTAANKLADDLPGQGASVALTSAVQHLYDVLDAECGRNTKLSEWLVPTRSTNPSDGGFGGA